MTDNPKRHRWRGFTGSWPWVVVVAVLIVAILSKLMPTGRGWQNVQPPMARVLHVYDGDTIKVGYKGREQRVRLFGIDAPEWRQPFSRAATRYLETILCDPVRITEKGRDTHGRLLAVLACDGTDINAEIVRAGYAWAYRYYSKDYIPEEESARAARAGLWQATRPVAPWDYRRRQ